jgi:hypothetical protein
LSSIYHGAQSLTEQQASVWDLRKVIWGLDIAMELNKFAITNEPFRDKAQTAVF